MLLLFTVVVCVVSVNSYQEDVPLYNEEGKVYLGAAFQMAYESMYAPLMKSEKQRFLETPESMKVRYNNFLNSLDKNMSTAITETVADLDEWVFSLPSPYLIKLGRTITDSFHSGEFFAQMATMDVMPWAFYYINRIGDEGFYRMWSVEHQLTADIYEIFTRRFYDGDFQQFVGQMMNIDKNCDLYKQAVEMTF